MSHDEVQVFFLKLPLLNGQFFFKKLPLLNGQLVGHPSLPTAAGTLPCLPRTQHGASIAAGPTGHRPPDRGPCVDERGKRELCPCRSSARPRSPKLCPLEGVAHSPEDFLFRGEGRSTFGLIHDPTWLSCLKLFFYKIYIPFILKAS